MPLTQDFWRDKMQARGFLRNRSPPITHSTEIVENQKQLSQINCKSLESSLHRYEPLPIYFFWEILKMIHYLKLCGLTMTIGCLCSIVSAQPGDLVSGQEGDRIFGAVTCYHAKTGFDTLCNASNPDCGTAMFPSVEVIADGVKLGVPRICTDAAFCTTRGALTVTACGGF